MASHMLLHGERNHMKVSTREGGSVCAREGSGRANSLLLIILFSSFLWVAKTKQMKATASFLKLAVVYNSPFV